METDEAPAGLDEVLASFRAEVESSGISDDALTALFEAARNETAASRHA